MYTRAPCHGKRQTSGRIIYILYGWQPATTVTNAEQWWLKAGSEQTKRAALF